jgi:hypothetical protein
MMTTTSEKVSVGKRLLGNMAIGASARNLVHKSSWYWVMAGTPHMGNTLYAADHRET